MGLNLKEILNFKLFISHLDMGGMKDDLKV